MENKLLEFLVESNAIEEEFSFGAVVDSVRAWKYAMKDAGKIDILTVKGIHYQIMRRLDPLISGKIRQISDYVGGEECLNPKYILQHLTDWCERYGKDTNWEDIKKRHIEFLKIHPFLDGNGRTARILMNLKRLYAGMELLVIHHGDEQRDYYKWFD